MDAVILRSTYRRRPDATRESSWFGTFDVEIAEEEPNTLLPPGTTLALWCTVLLEPTDASRVRVTERIAGLLVLEPINTDQPIALPWRIDGLQSRFPARHANDGPEAAWLVHPDGTTVELDVEPCVAVDPPTDRAAPTASEIGQRDQASVAVVPHPTHVESRGSNERYRHARLVPGAHDAVWVSVDALVQRAGHETFTATDDALDVDLDIDPTLDDEAYRLTIPDGDAHLTGGSEHGLRHGLITLTQLLIAEGVGDLDISDEPRVPFRAVHLDVARRWYEPDVVERLIDIAAWRKLNHVHLHLTDDEAWRFHVDGYPTLATVGGTRGHGLALPPLCGSGPDPYGRAYTDDEIGRWVERADQLGVTLIPEVDVPDRKSVV